MNTRTTLGTAILRGIYLALGTGGATFLVTWGATDNLKGASIAGGIAALSALGFRGGIEGKFDASRDQAGKVLSSDVGQPQGRV